MPGFSSITGLESVMFADNLSLDGTKRGGTLTSDGELWVGATASPHVKKGTIVSSTLSVGYASPNLTINTPGSVLANWIDEAANFAAVVGNGYFVTATATATLPSTPSQGNTVCFVADSAAVLTIQANTGQVIRIGSSVSSTAGTISSTSIGDSVTFVYRNADASWICREVIGNWNLA